MEKTIATMKVKKAAAQIGAKAGEELYTYLDQKTGYTVVINKDGFDYSMCKGTVKPGTAYRGILAKDSKTLEIKAKVA